MTDQAPSGALVAHQGGKGPARGYSWPPAGPGNGLALTHGAYSPRKVGERAELVLTDLLVSRPDLADDFGSSLPIGAYCQALARSELAHEGIEQAAAAGRPVNARLLESASAAARVAKELGDTLGIGPRAEAELRQIKAQTAVTVSVLVREAPAVLEALHRTLAALGLAERADAFNTEFAQQLALVAGGDDED